MLIAIETFGRYYKITQSLYAQFGQIRSNHIRFCYGNRDQQTYPITIFDFKGGWIVASPLRQTTNHAEGLPVERMLWIQNPDPLNE